MDIKVRCVRRGGIVLVYIVRVCNLTHKYPRSVLALNQVNLDINNGMFGLLGPNGAGKTTLMRILATLLRPTAGSVYVGTVDIMQNPGAIRSILGYLPQEFNTYRQLTVGQVLDYIALLKGIADGNQRKKAIDTVLEQTHLYDQRTVRVKALSGGMKQRLGIGQALLGNPQLLIVDEPTAGLDPQERIRFRNLLAEISSERVVILSTHIVGDVESSCSALAVLNCGQVRFIGKPGDLADCARGQVWEIETDEQGRTHIPTEAHIIATRRWADKLHLRVLCPTPPLPGAQLVEPGLEEGYLAVVGMQGGKQI